MKNAGKGPDDFTSGSSQRVWWICPRGHEWQATIGARSAGSGCPKCTRQTSRPELRILSELKPIFADIVHRHRIGRLECDLLIPSLKVAVQYDGAHFHRGKRDKDALNTVRLEKLGFTVFRFRDRSLPVIQGTIPFTEKGELKIGEIKRLLGELLRFGLSEIQERMLQRYPFCQRLGSKYTLPGDSLSAMNRDLASEWHPTRNGSRTPTSP